MTNSPIDLHASFEDLRYEIRVEAVLLDIRELAFVVPGESSKLHPEFLDHIGNTVPVLIGRISKPLRHVRSTMMNAGDRVAVCFSRGSDEVMAGLVGSLITVDAAQVFALPEEWSLERSVASASLAFAARALRASRFEADDTCLVLGLAPAGLFAIQLLRELGAATIVGVDADSVKRDLALTFGASEAMSPEDFTSSVVTDSMSGFNKVFFMSSGNDPLMSSIRAVSHLGIVVVAGPITEKDFVLSDYYREIIIKESTIMGIYRPTRDDWSVAVDKLGRSNMQLQEPRATISGAGARHRRLNEIAETGFVFGTLRTVLE